MDEDGGGNIAYTRVKQSTSHIHKSKKYSYFLRRGVERFGFQNADGIAYSWLGFLFLVLGAGGLLVLVSPIANELVNVRNMLVEAGIISAQTSATFEFQLMLLGGAPAIALLVFGAWMVIKANEKGIQ